MITTVALKTIARRIVRSVDVMPNSSYRTIGVKWWGEGAYERETIDGLQTAAKTLSIVRENDLIINKRWVRHGSIAIVDKNIDGCAASGEFPTFELDLTQVLPDWLHWYTKTSEFWEKCAHLSQGTSGKNRIKPDLFLTVEIPLPNIEEQRLIVGRIEELAGKVAEARGLRERSIEESKNLYPAMLTSLMQSHQADWTRELVSDVVIDISAGWSPQCEGYPASQGEWGVLKTTSVQWNKFIAKENKLLPKSLKPRPSLAVKKGDVLITRAGPRQRVGVVAAVREDHDNLMISDKLIRLKPNLNKLDPRFLEISLSSAFSQEYLVSRKTGLADAQVNISQAIIRPMPISYPPLSEQRHIVTYLDELQAKVDTMNRLRKEAQTELDALLPAILDKAFKGEL